MHSKLVNYFHRFKKEIETPYTKFFTQHDLADYKNKLPYLFGIENFCLRLYKALLKEEEICIYSDYDTDAVTATATMFWGLKEMGFAEEKLDFYAPDRFTEGYGMNLEAVENLSQKFDLILSVDCGINSVLEAELVNQIQGCDLIITDHHHLSGEIPPALAVVNPRLASAYKKNQQDLEILATEKKSKKNLSLYDYKPYFNQQEQVKLKKWLLEMKEVKHQEFLTESATGVAVAWFCLVWFGYFLAEIDNKVLT